RTARAAVLRRRGSCWYVFSARAVDLSWELARLEGMVGAYPNLVACMTAFAQSDSLKIAYTEAGTGPPIVFLHGVGATKRSWAAQLAMLAERFRCIAID